MRKGLMSILGLTLLASVASAQVYSIPLTLNTAIINGIAVTGKVVDGVSFSIPTARLVLKDGALQPGTNFNITLPVTNRTNRPIKVTFENYVPSANAQALIEAGLRITPVDSSAATLGANQTKSFVFNVRWEGTDAPASLSGQEASVSFSLKGTFSGTPANVNESF